MSLSAEHTKMHLKNFISKECVSACPIIWGNKLSITNGLSSCDKWQRFVAFAYSRNQLRPWWIALPSIWENKFKWFELSSIINRCPSCAHFQMCLPECMDIGYYINSTKPIFFYSLRLHFSPRPFGLKWTFISVPSKRYSCLSMLNC